MIKPLISKDFSVPDKKILDSYCLELIKTDIVKEDLEVLID